MSVRTVASVLASQVIQTFGPYTGHLTVDDVSPQPKSRRTGGTYF